MEELIYTHPHRQAALILQPDAKLGRFAAVVALAGRKPRGGIRSSFREACPLARRVVI